MSLIIENGSGVSGANSFASAAELHIYANSRGRIFEGENEQSFELEAALVRGALFLSRYEFIGDKASPLQALPWPRKNGLIDDYAVPSNSIPQQVKNANMEAALFALDHDILKHDTGLKLTSEKVPGIIEKSFSEQQGSFKLPSIDLILTPLLKPVSFNVVRA